MEQGGVAGPRSELTRQSLLPVRVSNGAFFHVRYGGTATDASEGAYIAHTYDSVRTLLSESKCITPAVYLCSRTVGGGMVARRVTFVRNIPHTDLCIFEFEDGRAVLWDESRYLGAVSAYVEIDAPLKVSQLTKSSVREQDAGDSGHEAKVADQDKD